MCRRFCCLDLFLIELLHLVNLIESHVKIVLQSKLSRHSEIIIICSFLVNVELNFGLRFFFHFFASNLVEDLKAKTLAC